MDPQSQLNFGWLLAPSGGGNGILFCNADHQGGVTTVTTVPAPVVIATGENNRLSNKLPENSLQYTHQLQCVPTGGLGPIKYEIIPKNLSQNIHLSQVSPLPIPLPQVSIPPPPSPIVVSSSPEVQTINSNGMGLGGNNQEKIGSKTSSSPDEDEVARRREINRLREKRRREQMTPKERAKARKKNRLRARKRRRNMTPEEREQEKERNRERARSRRAQKLQQQNTLNGSVQK